MRQNNQNRKSAGTARPLKTPVYDRPAAKPAAPARKELALETPQEFPLNRINFILMAIAAAVIIVGFLLMLGKGSTTEAFNPDIFSTRRIVVGPTIAFLGFLFMGVAIIWRKKAPKKENNTNSNEGGHA